MKHRGTQTEFPLLFVPKQNNLEQGGDGFQHGESNQATGSQTVDLFGSTSDFRGHYEPALSSQPTRFNQIREADANENRGTVQQDILDEDEDGLEEDLDSDDSYERMKKMCLLHNPRIWTS